MNEKGCMAWINVVSTGILSTGNLHATSNEEVRDAFEDGGGGRGVQFGFTVDRTIGHRKNCYEHRDGPHHVQYGHNEEGSSGDDPSESQNFD